MRVTVHKFELEFSTADGGAVRLTTDDIADYSFEFVGQESRNDGELYVPANPLYRGPGWVGMALVEPIYEFKMRLTSVPVLLTLGAGIPA